ncbi:MAG: hypothetical protein IRZ14_08910 [Chloroflexi bacterium]|nr:hypothetical protein [Chloroflexota bacterium]
MSEYIPDDYRWLRPPPVPYTRGRWTWETDAAGECTAYDQELRPLFRIQQLAGTTADLARFRAAAALHVGLTRLALIVRDFLDTHAESPHCRDPICLDALRVAVMDAERLLWDLPPDMPVGEIDRPDLSRAS